MKIQGFNNLYKAYNQDKIKPTNSIKNKEITAKNSDDMQVSTEGKYLSQIIALAKQAPDIREEKVAQIRASIQSGKYNVSAEEVAEKIVQSLIIDKRI